MQDNILQAYKHASEIVSKNLSTKAEIDAFNKVIEIGKRNVKTDKKSQILINWANNGIENAVLKESSPHTWLKNKLEYIALLEPSQKRKALQSIADGCSDNMWKILLYEKALNFIADENISFEEKCLNTTKICASLLILYDKKKNKENWQRINNLLQKTAYLALTDLESKLDEETDYNARLQLLSKIINLESKYLPYDVHRKKCLYRRLNIILKPDEEIEINNEIYNHKKIKDFLRKNAF